MVRASVVPFVAAALAALFGAAGLKPFATESTEPTEK